MQQAVWVGMIFVIGSISFTTYMVVMGTDNIVCQFLQYPRRYSRWPSQYTSSRGSAILSTTDMQACYNGHART